MFMELLELSFLLYSVLFFRWPEVMELPDGFLE